MRPNEHSLRKLSELYYYALFFLYLCVVVKEHRLPFTRPKVFSPDKLSLKLEISVVTDPNIDRQYRSEVVGLTGLEPVTPRLSSACSNQLSYRPKFGGAEEGRTPDL